MCLHASVQNITCSAQPEVAAVLDWYGPEADPAYWQRGREEVAGLQVVCEAHNVHVGGKILGASSRMFLGILDPLIYTDHFSIIINYYIFSVGSHCQDIDTFYLLSTPISLSCMCNSCALV